MQSKRSVTDELIRDLVQCVQAARDGAEPTSLFAMQCDLVLERAANEVDGLLKPRAVEEAEPYKWPGFSLQLECESY